MDFKERSERLDALKRKKAEHVLEKARVMKALEEDKMDRELRAQQKRVVQHDLVTTSGTASYSCPPKFVLHSNHGPLLLLALLESS